MNKTIWKFELETTGNQIIEIPTGAEILTVQVQRGTPCLWVLVDPKKPGEEREIETFGTGTRYDGRISRNYLGTYQLYAGSLIFHVFEKLKNKKP